MDRHGWRGLATTFPALLLALSLAATACGATAPQTGPPSPVREPASSSPPATTPPPATTTPPPSTTPSPALEDGKHFGFVRSVDPVGPPPSLVLDLAYFLTGEDAARAAQEHGDEYPPPNDYYIVNDNPMLRTLEVSPDVRIRLVDWADCCDVFVAGDLVPFAEGFANPDPSGAYRGPTSPYWIWVREGRVVKIQEQYLP